MIYIFDIDGTLADLSHRLHFIQQEPKDWESFYHACVDDEPIPQVILVARSLFPVAKLFIVSGRSDAIRMETINWMRMERIPCDLLHMRKQGDHREDSVIKAEMLADIQQRFPDEEIGGVFEDRKQCVDM